MPDNKKQRLKIAVFLDSTVLHRPVALRSGPLRTLAWLAGAGRITVAVSHVTREECLSEARLEAKKLHENATKALKPVEDLLKEMNELQVHRDATFAMEKCSAEFEHAILQRYDSWFSLPGVQILPVEPDDGKAVLDGYFSGRPPFAAVKNRDDIPDAFILEALQRLSNQMDEVHFISADNRFRSHVEKLKLRAWKTVQDFLGSQSAEALLTNPEADNAQLFLGAVCSVVEAREVELNDLIDGATQDAPVTEGHLFDEGDEARLDSISIDKGAVNFHFEKAIFLPPQALLVPFELVSEGLLSFYIEHYEWISATEGYGRHISISEWSDHYYAAQEYRDVRVAGSVIFRLNADVLKSTSLTPEEVRTHLAEADLDIDSIEDVEVLPIEKKPARANAD